MSQNNDLDKFVGAIARNAPYSAQQLAFLADQQPLTRVKLMQHLQRMRTLIVGPNDLQPQVITQSRVGISRTPAVFLNDQLTFTSDFDSFVSWISCNVRGIELTGAAQVPNAIFNQFINPADYVEVLVRRSTSEIITRDFVTLSSIAASSGNNNFPFNPIPFIAANNDVIIEYRVAAEVESIERLEINLHVERFAPFS